MYEYRARPIRVVDGDTLELVVDLGFGLTMGNDRMPFRVRVLGVDTPELRSSDPTVRMAAQEAKEFTATWVATAQQSGGSWPLVVATEKGDSFGRWLATVTRHDGRSLADDLLARGYRPYER